MGVFRFRVDQRNEQRPRLSVRPKWQNKFEDELATNTAAPLLVRRKSKLSKKGNVRGDLREKAVQGVTVGLILGRVDFLILPWQVEIW